MAKTLVSVHERSVAAAREIIAQMGYHAPLDCGPNCPRQEQHVEANVDQLWRIIEACFQGLEEA